MLFFTSIVFYVGFLWLLSICHNIVIINYVVFIELDFGLAPVCHKFLGVSWLLWYDSLLEFEFFFLPSRNYFIDHYILLLIFVDFKMLTGIIRHWIISHKSPDLHLNICLVLFNSFFFYFWGLSITKFTRRFSMKSFEKHFLNETSILEGFFGWGDLICFIKLVSVCNCNLKRCDLTIVSIHIHTQHRSVGQLQCIERKKNFFFMSILIIFIF